MILCFLRSVKDNQIGLDFLCGSYVGEFKDSKYHGQGTFTFPDGQVLNGQFENNEFME